MRIGRGVTRSNGALWPPILATRGVGSASGVHAHHAMHLLLAREGDLRVVAGAIDARACGVLTAPDVAHAIDATGREVLLVFVDPESDAGERLRPSVATVRLFDAAERDALLHALPEDPMIAGDACVTRLAGTPARTMHPRVRTLLRWLRDADPREDTSIGALAARTRLSESRLAHVFRDSVGLPLRPYLLWQKVQRATVAIVTGATMTEAATRAGFSDAAHMTRTFRRMFGMTPSALRPQQVRSRPVRTRAPS